MNLTEACEQFIRECRVLNAWGTVNTYELRLSRFRRYVGDRPITPELVSEYTFYLLGDKVRPAGVMNYLETLTTFFRWAVSKKLIDVSPMGKQPRLERGPVLREPMLYHDYRRLLGATEDPGWTYAFHCAWNTGLRLSDVALMRRKSILFDDKAIDLIPHKTKRLGIRVQIPIPDEFLLHLQKEILRVGQSEFIAPELERNYRLTQHMRLNYEFNIIRVRAGVTKSFHCFRHGFITRHLEANVSPAIVASLTGLTITQIMTYAHISISAKRTAMSFKTQ